MKTIDILSKENMKFFAKIALALLFLGVIITGIVFATKGDNSQSTTTLKYIIEDGEGEELVRTEACIISKEDPIDDITNLETEINYFNNSEDSICGKEYINQFIIDENNMISDIEYRVNEDEEWDIVSINNLYFNEENITSIEDKDLVKGITNVLILEI